MIQLLENILLLWKKLTQIETHVSNFEWIYASKSCCTVQFKFNESNNTRKNRGEPVFFYVDYKFPCGRKKLRVHETSWNCKEFEFIFTSNEENTIHFLHYLVWNKFGKAKTQSARIRMRDDIFLIASGNWYFLLTIQPSNFYSIL